MVSTTCTLHKMFQAVRSGSCFYGSYKGTIELRYNKLFDTEVNLRPFSLISAHNKYMLIKKHHTITVGKSIPCQMWLCHNEVQLYMVATIPYAHIFFFS